MQGRGCLCGEPDCHEVTEGSSSERRWKDIGGILLTEEKVQKAGRVSKGVAESALSRAVWNLQPLVREDALNSKYRLQ